MLIYSKKQNHSKKFIKKVNLTRKGKQKRITQKSAQKSNLLKKIDHLKDKHGFDQITGYDILTFGKWRQQ